MKRRWMAGMHFNQAVCALHRPSAFLLGGAGTDHPTSPQVFFSYCVSFGVWSWDFLRWNWIRSDLWGCEKAGIRLDSVHPVDAWAEWLVLRPVYTFWISAVSLLQYPSQFVVRGVCVCVCVCWWPSFLSLVLLQVSSCWKKFSAPLLPCACAGWRIESKREFNAKLLFIYLFLNWPSEFALDFKKLDLIGIYFTMNGIEVNNDLGWKRWCFRLNQTVPLKCLFAVKWDSINRNISYKHYLLFNTVFVCKNLYCSQLALLLTDLFPSWKQNHQFKFIVQKNPPVMCSCVWFWWKAPLPHLWTGL